MSNAGLVL